MAGPRLAALQRQFDDLKAGIDTINRAATERGTDLKPEEAEQLDKLYERAETIKPEIEREAEREGSIASVGEVLAKVNASSPNVHRAVTEPKPAEMTAGEFLASFYTSYHPESDGAPEEHFKRAAAYFERAQQLTTDTAGIIPTPIIGAVIKFADSRRPVFTSLTDRSMPAKGKTFERPRVTQRVLVEEQSAEGAALASRKMVITSDTVTKRTFGGTLDLSHQDIDWTEPSALQIVVDDFVDVYAEVTETESAEFMADIIAAGHAASAGSAHSPWDDTNVGTIVKSVVDGVVKVYGKAKRMPDRVWMDLASWALLTSTTNTNNDRTALSMIREALAQLGDGAEGIRFVVGPQLAPDTRIVGVSTLVEGYETQKGLLRAELPSTLTVQLAYAGYIAHWARHEGFVQLGTAP